MARNFVEYHIQDGAFHTFKVDAGQTVKIGQLVELTGELAVSVAGAGADALGVVYSGTVGIDGLNDGYKGDNGDVVTVIVLKPLVYLEAGASVTAGNALEAGANGVAIPNAGTNPKVGTALKSGASGERFLAILG
jgi:hypothetical protein